MNSKKILFLAMLAAVTPGICGQDLNKEITIDRDIVPAQRAAVRPSVFPQLTIPATSHADPRIESSTTSARISPSLALYEPAATVAAFPATPFRGYVDLGYFPMGDIALSAGYAIISNERTNLNAWLQLDNRNYKAPANSLWDSDKFHTLDALLGVDFGRKFGRNRLTLSLDFAASSTAFPSIWQADGRALYNTAVIAAASVLPPADPEELTAPDHQALSNIRVHLKGDFDGHINDALTYGISARGGIFSASSLPADVKATGANAKSTASADLGLRFSGNVTDNASLGIRAEAKWLRYNAFLPFADIYTSIFNNLPFPPGGARSMAQVDFIPSAEYNGGSFYGRIGARLGLSFNSGKTFHVAPDVLLAVNPDARFGAWVKFGGGVIANSPEEVFLLSRYADPRATYDFSNLALTGQVGVRVGPFYGASLSLTADYAAANNYLMPLQIASLNTLINTFSPWKIRAWKLGARFDWTWRRILAVGLSYEVAPGASEDKAWIYWRDRARQVAGITVSVTPISPLTVDLGFTARLSRRQAIEEIVPTIYINDQDYYSLSTRGRVDTSLGDLTNLSAGASWRFSDELSVFARFENILAKRSSLIFDVPTRGFTGLFGVAYKF